MTEEQIYQEMLEAFQLATGYEMHAQTDLAVRLRAAAAQLMGLYRYGDRIFRQAFPQTAEGEYLDRHGVLRGGARRAAQRAQGSLSFEISVALDEDLKVPKGTVCLTGEGTAFETIMEGILRAGSLSVTVVARAVEPGTLGNVVAGAVTRMQEKPDGIETVINRTPFSGGREQESDEEYRKRILGAYQGLGNGANMAYYRDLALSVEGIRYAKVIPCVDGAGTVGIVVSTDEGTVSGLAVTMLERLLEERKEFGITVTVSTPETVSVSVVANLRPKEGISFETAKTAVQQALEGCFQGDRLGRPVYLAELIGAAMATGTLENIQIAGPEADVAVGALQKPVLTEVKLGGF